MREIKFRAWSKEEGMINVARLDIADGSLYKRLITGKAYDYWNDVILMQYTGLKDKNGTEICQGDIVECKCGNTGKTILRQVEYIGVSFCTKNGSFYNQKTKQREYCYIPLKPYVKVVGNIYENPELLKEGE